MKKRNMNEMISYFNCKVADMDIEQKYKMELLGMITAIGIEYEQPERKTGKWIRESLVTDYPYKCSACKKYSRAMYDFCPNCGAKMEGSEKE